MKIVNLTPHTVNICDASGEIIASYPSEGTCRVSTNAITVAKINGIDVVHTTYGTVEGLPEPTEGTVYIVSMIVGQAVSGREDVVCPDTSPQAVVRFPQDHPQAGLIKGVTRFAQY